MGMDLICKQTGRKNPYINSIFFWKILPPLVGCVGLDEKRKERERFCSIGLLTCPLACLRLSDLISARLRLVVQLVLLLLWPPPDVRRG